VNDRNRDEWATLIAKHVRRYKEQRDRALERVTMLENGTLRLLSGDEDISEQAIQQDREMAARFDEAAEFLEGLMETRR